MYNISFIGAGNVTFRLSLALQQAGYNIRTIVNRSADKAESVVRALKRHKSHAVATDDYNAIPADCDLIIISYGRDLNLIPALLSLGCCGCPGCSVGLIILCHAVLRFYSHNGISFLPWNSLSSVYIGRIIFFISPNNKKEMTEHSFCGVPSFSYWYSRIRQYCFSGKFFSTIPYTWNPKFL